MCLEGLFFFLSATSVLTKRACLPRSPWLRALKSAMLKRGPKLVPQGSNTSETVAAYLPNWFDSFSRERFQSLGVWS